MQRSLLVQALLNMATGSVGAKLSELIVDKQGIFDAGTGKGYNPVTVPSGSVGAFCEKGDVTNNSVILTPKAQIYQSGWVNQGSVDGQGVEVSAAELVNGVRNISNNGTFDVTNYKDVKVDCPIAFTSISFTPTSPNTVTVNSSYLNKSKVSLFIIGRGTGSYNGLVFSLPLVVSQNISTTFQYYRLSGGSITPASGTFYLSNNTLTITANFAANYQYTLYALG